MPEYRRPFSPGGTFFFTVVTQDRQPILCSDLARPLLRSAIAATHADRPFDQLAMVLLNDHMHALWELPPGDSDFSTRWAAIKARFTKAWLLAGGTEATVTADRALHRGRGVWQQRFYDHLIRDENDLNRHLDYIHYNPVKHGALRPARMHTLIQHLRNGLIAKRMKRFGAATAAGKSFACRISVGPTISAWNDLL